MSLINGSVAAFQNGMGLLANADTATASSSIVPLPGSVTTAMLAAPVASGNTTVGDASNVAQLTYNNKGQVMSAVAVPIAAVPPGPGTVTTAMLAAPVASGNTTVPILTNESCIITYNDKGQIVGSATQATNASQIQGTNCSVPVATPSAAVTEIRPMKGLVFDSADSHTAFRGEGTIATGAGGVVNLFRMGIPPTLFGCQVEVKYCIIDPGAGTISNGTISRSQCATFDYTPLWGRSSLGVPSYDFASGTLLAATTSVEPHNLSADGEFDLVMLNAPAAVTLRYGFTVTVTTCN